jgi:hypothetical protein
MSAFEDDEKIEAISLGSIVGGATIVNRPWRDAIKDLGQGIRNARIDVEVPLNLNVVFHVPGNMLKPEFVGVRTGIFSKSKSLLMMQIAIPEGVPTDPMAYLKGTVQAAIDEAGRWAARRKVPIDISKLRQILDRAYEASSSVNEAGN